MPENLAQGSPNSDPVLRILQLCGVHSSCKGCGAEIYWLTTKHGKRMPFTTAGLPHWEDCPMAPHFHISNQCKG